jgi:hypothetical protein
MAPGKRPPVRRPLPVCVANYRMRPAVAPEYQPAPARPNQRHVKRLATHRQRLKVLSTG